MKIFKKFLGINSIEDFKNKIDYNRLPVHIAIILDGNGRWAKKRGIPRNIGHREGAKTLEKVVLFCNEIGIKYLTVYAFSTENWKRPKEEVDALMKLLKEFLDGYQERLGKKNIKINILGDIRALPPDFQDEIIEVEKFSSKNSGLSLNIALNYGSRIEILNAVKDIAADLNNGKIKEDEITEERLSDYLYTKGNPDPDLLIRTSGEYRLSNFLLWQLAYTELWFDKVLWPDFSEQHLLSAIIDYQKRNRRFGGI